MNTCIDFHKKKKKLLIHPIHLLNYVYNYNRLFCCHLVNLPLYKKRSHLKNEKDNLKRYKNYETHLKCLNYDFLTHTNTFYNIRKKFTTFININERQNHIANIKNNIQSNHKKENNILTNNIINNNNIYMNNSHKIHGLLNKQIAQIKNSTHTHPRSYNFDPCTKTKKIQVYYNCEMNDVIRKINYIKKFLSTGSPVDIFLIYNTHDHIKTRNIKMKKQTKISKNKISNIEDEQQEEPHNHYDRQIFKNYESNKITKFLHTQKLNETKYSLHLYIKINFILNHIRNISIVDEIFRHIQNKNHIILIKAYPK
ncbi:translation initiation factor IF-3 [Plasmodium falciparum NF54]|uniref:Translation initiation factor IF-3, putative n=2 Tax=Plasmodium falciparum TaxID=5833 RepID=Q8IJ64_PLAF7|nr:translation initiation factor IF-3, putative [Plasmodium falciparum 3D7]EWC88247.1 hypothetical protein PFNF54_02956 [Plasmodium falciparum NF54]KAF4327934.1 translation initiation factor IF-3 [Plasmodium falciparum NF54]PKC43522.1 translation initiation factor IF-3 [Plasmodium falciparum NF54]CZT98603.1 translation initiation factor IF-3, putative [Plasmodium falciparum 3D7]|eukprot:XP_001347620.1 translation initiation factor IF-3, putative [Plasmodium falciparum 3D7]